MKQPFDYSQIYYNEVIDYLESKWHRTLSDHEKHVLIEGYKFGRLVEMEGCCWLENALKIIGNQKQS